MRDNRKENPDNHQIDYRLKQKPHNLAEDSVKATEWLALRIHQISSVYNSKHPTIFAKHKKAINQVAEQAEQHYRKQGRAWLLDSERPQVVNFDFSEYKAADVRSVPEYYKQVIFPPMIEILEVLAHSILANKKDINKYLTEVRENPQDHHLMRMLITTLHEVYSHYSDFLTFPKDSQPSRVRTIIENIRKVDMESFRHAADQYGFQAPLPKSQFDHPDLDLQGRGRTLEDRKNIKDLLTWLDSQGGSAQNSQNYQHIKNILIDFVKEWVKPGPQVKVISFIQIVEFAKNKFQQEIDKLKGNRFYQREEPEILKRFQGNPSEVGHHWAAVLNKMYELKPDLKKNKELSKYYDARAESIASAAPKKEKEEHKDTPSHRPS